MRTIVVAALLTAIVSGSAMAQPQDHAPAKRKHVAQAERTLVVPAPRAYQPTAPAQPKLFTIGNLPVGLWAPVPPPYDARANHNNAANPLWWDDGQL